MFITPVVITQSKHAALLLLPAVEDTPMLTPPLAAVNMVVSIVIPSLKKCGQDRTRRVAEKQVRGGVVCWPCGPVHTTLTSLPSMWCICLQALQELEKAVTPGHTASESHK